MRTVPLLFVEEEMEIIIEFDIVPTLDNIYHVELFWILAYKDY